jgi:DNA-binding response OmpR family regulator
VDRPKSDRPPRGPRILVVEDDKECRAAVKDVLEESSFVVTEAGNGQVALEHMTRGLHPALVILDLQMPGMSGHDLLQIMDGYKRLSRLPVLVISGTPRSEFACGGAVIGFMSKPLDLIELLDTVNACVGVDGGSGRNSLSTIPD